ncbi:relaxase/mobilization nuclease domain-containing protein (plasmid) [Sphaerotilaceae bacterium SBD11-9]
MSFIEDVELDDALNPGRVRRKGNNTQNLKSKAKRVAKGAPEVLVKVKSFAKGGVSVKRQLQYISRNGQVDMETEQGETITGRVAVAEHIQSWRSELDNGGKYPNRRDTAHIILSMPPGTDPTAVLEASRQFARKTFAENHEYVLALHTDEESPHVHLIVKALGFDGKRLHIDRERSQEMREVFADALRDQGTEAEATPAASRGQPGWQYSAAARHIARGDEKREPRQSTVRQAQVYAARDALIAEVTGQPAPVDVSQARAEAAAAAASQRWSAAAAVMAKSGDEELAGLASELGTFARAIKPALSTRQRLAAELLAGPGVTRAIVEQSRDATPPAPTKAVPQPDRSEQAGHEPRNDRDLDR